MTSRVFSRHKVTKCGRGIAMEALPYYVCIPQRRGVVWKSAMVKNDTCFLRSRSHKRVSNIVGWSETKSRVSSLWATGEPVQGHLSLQLVFYLLRHADLSSSLAWH